MNKVRTRKIFDEKMIVLVLLQIIIGVLIMAMISILNKDSSPIAKFEYLRDSGNKLQAAGLPEEAIRLYSLYLAKDSLDNKTKTAMAFTLGNLYEEVGEYEKSLAEYYKIESIDENSKYKTDASKRIVVLLERLKKYSAAKYALKTQTDLNKSPMKGGEIVAKIEGRPIYLHQINDALEELPETYKREFNNLEGKKKFLQKYVADELLAVKARKMEFHKDSEIRSKMEKVEKQLLIQKVLKGEIEEKVSSNNSDIKNYFTANKDRYDQKERASVLMIVTKNKKESQEVIQKLKKNADFKKLVIKYSVDQKTKKNEGLYQGFVFRGEPFITNNNTMSDLIFKAKEGGLTTPQVHNGKYYIFKIKEKHKAFSPGFEQIKRQVEYDYKIERSQELYKIFMAKILKSEDVELFMEKML